MKKYYLCYLCWQRVFQTKKHYNHEKIPNIKLVILCILALTSTSTFLSGQVLKTWNGSFSSNWHDSANWTPAGVPGADDSVDIPAGTPTSPVISTTDAKAYDLIVQPDAFLEVTTYGALTINVFFSPFLRGGNKNQAIGGSAVKT